MSNTIVLHMRLPQDLDEALRTQAEVEYSTKTSIVKKALKAYCERGLA